MTGHRARGVLLYTAAAVVLAAGTAWWVTAAPDDPQDPQVAEWRSGALRRLPDDPAHVRARTMSLPAGEEREVSIPLDAGRYEVLTVCAGGADSEVRVRPEAYGGSYSQFVGCADDDQPVSFHLRTGGEVRLRVTVDDTGPVVFRYAVRKSGF